MSNLALSTHDFDGHAVVALCGELDLAFAPSAGSHLVAAVAAHGPSVIVDLAGLESIGYCGLGNLVRVLKWTRESGGDLALAAPQQQVRRVLKATGLIDVFAVYPSVAMAANNGAGRTRGQPPAALACVPGKAYNVSGALDPSSHTAKCRGYPAGPGVFFSARTGAGEAPGPEDGENPRELNLPNAICQVTPTAAHASYVTD